MTKPTGNPIGRPPRLYDPEIGERICDRIANSTDSLAKICAEEGMPPRRMVFYWLNNNPEFVELYKMARDAQGQFIADQILEIADETKEDYVKRLNFDGPAEGWEVNGEAIQRSRLRIDSRKWLASKLAPDKYSDQIKVDQTVGVSSGLSELLERIGKQGTRLVPGIDLAEIEFRGEEEK